ncbi:hypothetical protein NQ315_010845 [Exocentrus adspersus]|uniref:Uncharacterized protein n=1 Tax=Exocentrus adspersus TaxID=1586481 RepID=A0AAV8VB73_9CUCU|nr:hypothetical protein NQ315_010845 [Exocentrus adspersus]
MQWNYIHTGMKEHFQADFLQRTLKERATKLIEKYRKEQLQYKTGTEEEISELGNLLEETYVESVDEQVIAKELRVTPKSRRIEKRIADTERDELLSQAGSEDTAPGPMILRKKRKALNPEDELIKQKQQNDYELEIKRLKLEETKIQYEYEMQLQKIALEKQKIEIEKEKNKIIEQENKRRDMWQMKQLEQQQQVNELLMVLAKK